MQYPDSAYRTGKKDIRFTLRKKIPVNQTHLTKLTKSKDLMRSLGRLLVVLVVMPPLFPPSRSSNSFQDHPPPRFVNNVRTPPQETLPHRPICPLTSPGCRASRPQGLDAEYAARGFRAARRGKHTRQEQESGAQGEHNSHL